MSDEKRLIINLIDGNMHSWEHSTLNSTILEHIQEDFYLRNIYKDDYKHIYLDHKISGDEFEKALRVIMTKFMQDDIKRILIKLDEFDKGLAPAKEMTLDEIEKELGYKVKVINKAKGKK